MNVHRPTRMSIEEYGRWIERQDRKFELVRGVPKLLPYVKLNHNRIAMNLVNALAAQIDPARFEVAAGDFAVRTGPDSIRYADVMIFPAGKGGQTLSVEDAVLVFEILSKSSIHEDFGDKRHEYQALESLQSYVVLGQDEPQVWLWQRDGEGNWPVDPEQVSEGAIALDCVGAKLDLPAVYRGVTS